MPKSLNLLILLGNVGADPEVRTTDGGHKVAQFSLATNRIWTDRSGQRQEKVEWHRCLAWNPPRGQQLADLVESYVRKGDRLQLRGRVEYRTFTDREQQTRTVAEVLVDDIILLSPKRDGREPVPAGPTAEDAADEFGGDDDLPF